MALPDLRFDIRADDETSRAFRQVREETERTRKAMRGLGVDIRSAAVGFAAGFGTAALASLHRLPQAIGRAVAEVDKLGDAASRIGLTAEALQQMRFAGGQTGVAVTAVDMALQRFSRRSAEAARGAGVLKEVFEANNIALRNTDGTMRTNIELLDDYADLIARAGSEQERLLLAFKAFDSEGAAFVNTVAGGASALQRFRDEAPAVREELVSVADQVADEWARMTASIDANLKNVVLSVIGGARSMKDELDRSLSGFGNALGGAITSPQQSLRNQLNIINGGGPMREALLGGDPLGFRDFRSPTDFVGSRQTATGVGRKLTGRDALLAAQAFSDAFEPDDPRAAIADNLARQEKSAAEAARQQEDALRELTRQQEDALRELTRQMDETRVAASDVMGGFLTDLQSGIRGTDLLASSLSRVANLLINSGVDSLISSLFGASGSTGTGGAGGLLNSVLGAFGGSFGGARARGGPVMPGRSYLVGENGTETFVPNTGGRILPAGAGGGTTINVNINGARGDRELKAMVQEGVARGIAATERGRGRAQLKYG